MKKMIVLLAGLFMCSCGLPEMKELTKESKKEMDKIVKELELEKFDHSYNSNTKNGKTTSWFSVELANIDDSIDFKPYNDRIISLFEKSGYNFKDQDYIRIGYFKNYFAVDTYVSLLFPPNLRQLIKV